MFPPLRTGCGATRNAVRCSNPSARCGYKKEGRTCMRKAILLGAALTLCTALAIAQDAPTAGSAGQAGATASSSDQATSSSTGNTVQGCLSGSAGSYMLTDSTGVMYQLSGSDSDLSANVNKEVEVTGTAGSKASASASNSPDSS